MTLIFGVREDGIQKEYLWLGLIPIAVIENNEIYFIHADHLGTPRIATDNNKQVVWQWQSTPFGKGKPAENGLTLNLRFPGQYYDQESGLHYNHFRYYEVESGRYINSDPLGLVGTNIFTYVENNPLRKIDISGQKVYLAETPVGPLGIGGHLYIIIEPDHKIYKTPTN